MLALDARAFKRRAKSRVWDQGAGTGGGMEAILGRDTQSLKTMAELVSKLICD